MEQIRIQQITTDPWHPVSNELAERWVQTLKTLFKKSLMGSLETQLFSYRIKSQYRTLQEGAPVYTMYFNAGPN